MTKGKTMKQARAAEKIVCDLEKEIRKKKDQLARARRRIPLEPVPDYVLHSVNGKAVTLSSLFGKKSELILIHNMGKSCPYCALWADGFNGMLKHLEDRAAFVLESPDRPKTQKKIVAKRGWTMTVVSSFGTTFRQDLGFETDGDPWPGVSTFYKDKKGKIFRAAFSYFGPGDNYCSLWDLFDLLPKGAAGWEAKFNY